MDENVKAFNPVDLGPELQRKSEIDDLLKMRSLDQSLGVEKYIVEHPVFELNVRLVQYFAQIQNLPRERLIIQAVFDFRQIVKPLQNDWRKLNRFLPVAFCGGQMIYISHQDIFVTEKPTQVLENK